MNTTRVWWKIRIKIGLYFSEIGLEKMTKIRKNQKNDKVSVQPKVNLVLSIPQKATDCPPLFMDFIKNNRRVNFWVLIII